MAEDTGIKSLSELDGQTFNPDGTGAAAAVTHAALDALGIHPEYFAPLDRRVVNVRCIK